MNESCWGFAGCWEGWLSWYAKNSLFDMPFIYKTDLFTKTGSGQT
jgi:hypothetical protein